MKNIGEDTKKKFVIVVSITLSVILLGFIIVCSMNDNNTSGSNTEKTENTEERLESSTNTEGVIELETQIETKPETESEDEVVLNDSETMEESTVESNKKEENIKEEPPKNVKDDGDYDEDGRKIFRVIDGVNFYADWEYTNPDLAAMDAGFDTPTQDPVTGFYCILYKKSEEGDGIAEAYRAWEKLDEYLFEHGIIGKGGGGGNCGSGMAGVVFRDTLIYLPTEDAKKKFDETGEKSYFSDGWYDYEYNGEKWVKVIPPKDEYDAINGEGAWDAMYGN